MICDLTRFLICIPTRDSTALTAANCLIEHLLCRYNIPSRLVSDNATSFLSNVIKELTRLFSIKKIFTTPYRPEGNKVERAHKTLNAYLRAFTFKNRDNWDDLLKYAAFAYNNTVHSTTGFTPHELLYGFKVQLPNHLTKHKKTYNYDNYADQVRNNLATSLQLAKERLTNKKYYNKKYYDRDTNECEINVNDLVLVINKNKKHKFDDVYEGPYRVLESNDSYVTIMRKGKRSKLHKNLLKKTRAEYDKEPPLAIPIIA